MNFLTVEDTLRFIPGLPKGWLAEFGVYHGDCLGRIILGAAKQNYCFEGIVGFDSFQGLPKEESGGLPENPDWPQGAFSVSKDYGLASVDEAIKFVRNRIHKYLEDNKITTWTPIQFVPGFFSKSLTEDVGWMLCNSVSYLHIDVDLYISTLQVLDFVYKYQILKSGALVRFDDWKYGQQYLGNNEAFAKMNAKYGASWQAVADNVYIFQGI